MPKLGKSVNKEFVHNEYKNFNGWEAAIKAARLQLLRAQVAQREMKSVIDLFTEKMNAGEPWPGDVAGTGNKSVPA
jgi:hypothetical protein